MPVLATFQWLAARSADQLLGRLVPQVTAEATCGMHSKKCCVNAMLLGYVRLDIYGNICSECFYIPDGGYCIP